MRSLSKVYVIAIVTVLLTTSVAGAFQVPSAIPQSQSLTAAPEEVSFVTEVTGTGVQCRGTSRAETFSLSERAAVERHVITPASHTSSSGLLITLRATPQLESFPQAKAAFLVAAARWESLISTPISI